MEQAIWRRAAELVPVVDPLHRTPAERQAIGEKYAELLEVWKAEVATRDVLRRAQEATEKAVRQANRMEESARRRSAPRADRRSPNRPTHV